ncbi:MAG: NYN domain-containing protein [Gemmiger sp.]
MKRLSIGILAHVDAGKTTLSEAMLYRAGALRHLGRVDHGDTLLDSFALERSRGITIFSKMAVLNTGDCAFTLLDTPGHVDFSPEMERALQVMDCAILVISGTDGVQSHTETLWQLLARYHVPVFLFVNKMDLPGADRTALLAGLQKRLGANCVDFTAPAAERDEALALCGEQLMEEYLAGGSIGVGTAARAIAARQVFPCWFGSALRLKGVDEFLQGLCAYTVAPAGREKSPFGAQVFKLAEDDAGARLTYLKVTGGVLRVKDAVSGTGVNGPWSEKVNQIRLYSGAKYQNVNEALPGMVCAVTGLSHARPGQGLGAQPDAAIPSLEPVMTYRVELPAGTDVTKALTCLRRLEEEEPQLHVAWNEQLDEIHVQLMGEVQLEVLRTLLAQRFGLEVRFGQGSIVYRETISAPVEGVGHFEPLRHYAEVHLLLEPAPRGSGLQFAADCREDALDKNWQRLILTHLAEKTHPGVLTGAPVTDLKITLIAGRAHLKHTEGGDFRQATYRAVRQGLRTAAAQGNAQLLEPWYRFRLEVPAGLVGRAMTDLQRMDARFEPPVTQQGGESSLLTGTAPVAAMQGYSAELTRYSRGVGRISCTPDGYRPCHNADAVIAAAGYNADADVENTADSVFCAHGAGYVVKWDEVPARAHVQTGWGKPEPEETQAPVRRRAAVYGSSLAEDKELMAIFERTYGPIRRRGVPGRADGQEARRRFAPVKKETPAAGLSAPPPAGPEYLLVDGYNMIFAWDDLAAMARDNLDAARRRLMDLLCNYRGVRRCEVILVFDAYKVKGNPGTVENYHNIHVVYTREAETADMYIERVTHELGRKHRVRVATSDGPEQIIIFGNGALRVSARAFRQEMDTVEREIREYLDAQR